MQPSMDMAQQFPITEMGLIPGIRLTSRGISVLREIIHILDIYQRDIKK
jgi:hypothetical protein